MMSFLITISFFLLNFVNLSHYLEHFESLACSLSAYNIAQMLTKNPFMIRNEQQKKRSITRMGELKAELDGEKLQ